MFKPGWYYFPFDLKRDANYFTLQPRTPTKGPFETAELANKARVVALLTSDKVDNPPKTVDNPFVQLFQTEGQLGGKYAALTVLYPVGQGYKLSHLERVIKETTFPYLSISSEFVPAEELPLSPFEKSVEIHKLIIVINTQETMINAVWNQLGLIQDGKFFNNQIVPVDSIGRR